jgi:hypothetical protein
MRNPEPYGWEAMILRNGQLSICRIASSCCFNRYGAYAGGQLEA